MNGLKRDRSVLTQLNTEVHRDVARRIRAYAALRGWRLGEVIEHATRPMLDGARLELSDARDAQNMEVSGDET